MLCNKFNLEFKLANTLSTYSTSPFQSDPPSRIRDVRFEIREEGEQTRRERERVITPHRSKVVSCFRSYFPRAGLSRQRPPLFMKHAWPAYACRIHVWGLWITCVQQRWNVRQEGAHLAACKGTRTDTRYRCTKYRPRFLHVHPCTTVDDEISFLIRVRQGQESGSRPGP